jgi:hypothetical protein
VGWERVVVVGCCVCEVCLGEREGMEGEGKEAREEREGKPGEEARAECGAGQESRNGAGSAWAPDFRPDAQKKVSEQASRRVQCAVAVRGAQEVYLKLR